MHTLPPTVSKMSGLVDMVLASGFKPGKALNLGFAYDEATAGVQTRDRANLFFLPIFHHLIIGERKEYIDS